MKKELVLLQRQIDIAKSVALTIKYILAVNLVEYSFLFEDKRVAMLHSKSRLTKCLETFIEIDDFCFNKTKITNNQCHCWFYIAGTKNTHEKIEYYKWFTEIHSEKKYKYCRCRRDTEFLQQLLQKLSEGYDRREKLRKLNQ